MGCGGGGEGGYNILFYFRSLNGTCIECEMRTVNESYLKPLSSVGLSVDQCLAKRHGFEPHPGYYFLSVPFNLFTACSRSLVMSIGSSHRSIVYRDGHIK